MPVVGHVLLIVTWFVLGQAPNSYQLEFTDADKCERAKLTLRPTKRNGPGLQGRAGYATAIRRCHVEGATSEPDCHLRAEIGPG